MANWDIKVMTALDVVSRAAAAAGVGDKGKSGGTGYPSNIIDLEAAFTSLGSALTQSPAVADRLMLYMEKSVQLDMSSIMGHTGSAVQGTYDAISAYNAGDLEMAATANKNAAKATYPKPPGS